MTRLVVGCVCLSGISLLACAPTAWERAVSEDTPAAYHHFMRQHPGSKHRDEAQRRLEYHALLRRPTLAGFDQFCADHPGSPLIEKLRPHVEEQAFFAARAAGTVEAYLDFMARFPGGAFGKRAAGNAEYVKARGFDGRPQDLELFAQRHPKSDFAAEAHRSAQSVATRQHSGFDRVELVVDISPETPERDRLQRIFLERAQEAYKRARIPLVTASGMGSPQAADGRPIGRLTIRHSEELEQSSVSEGQLSRPGVFARTEIILEPRPEGSAIFQREFSVRVPPQDYIEGTSVLLASKPAELYWSEFFVPVATWSSQVCTRPVIELPKKAAAVDSARGRVAVLFEDGDFQVLELADPLAPMPLAEYSRTEKFDRYEGIRIQGPRLILFGQDGLEIVRLSPEGVETVARWERGVVGSVIAVAPLGEQLLVASSRGLLLLGEDDTEPERIMRRVVLGLAVVGDTLVFTDGDTVYMSTLELLQERRVLAQLRAGREFAPRRVRGLESRAVVIGQRGVLIFDLASPKRPRLLSRLRHEETGRVEDASLLGGRIALLGDRGIQLLDAQAQRVVESVDVKPRLRLTNTDRHLALVGGRELQVVDTTPFATWASIPATAAESPASPEAAR